ncbi:type II secretion system F family protein [Actinomadura sp. 6N118]|uniref:type II secretion system F family protein n=1 Tax=Actinomadura sp. 6N118 TaxID=3375151 RepID=UPI0037ADF4AB
MTAMLAAVTGALIAAGLVCVAAAFRRPAPGQEGPPAQPPSRLLELARAAFAPQRRRRVMVGIAAAILVLGFTGWPVAAVATLAGSIALPVVLSKRPAQQRIDRLEALEQWTRRLADVLGASRALEDAIIASARKPPEPIAEQVRALAGRIRSRMPTDRAIRLWADELSDPVADRIAAALILAASRRGPGVRLVLTELSELVAKDVTSRREIDASRAEHRTTLRWVVIFLVGYTVFVSLRQSYSAPFGTPAGQMAMAVVAGLYAAGLTWIYRLGRGQSEPRLLGSSTPPPPEVTR